jgi:hypothetical protein
LKEPKNLVQDVLLCERWETWKQRFVIIPMSQMPISLLNTLLLLRSVLSPLKLVLDCLILYARISLVVVPVRMYLCIFMIFVRYVICKSLKYW